MSTKKPPAGPFRDRIRELRRVRAADLIPNPENWRTHPPAQAAALRSVLDEIGFADAALVREVPEGLQLIDGHLRAELEPEAEVPVLILDVDEAEARLLLATLDPLAAMAGTDGDRLAELLGEITLSSPELEAHLEGYNPTWPAGRTDPDEVPEPPAEPITKPGDLWLMAEHRLLCGDALTDVPELMAGAQADLLWTDPPYGVAYQTKLSKEEAVARRRRTDGLEVSNDALGDAATRELVRDALIQVREAMRPGASFYIAAPPGDMELVFRLALLDAGLPLREAIVWVKDVFVMGRQDYHWRHETVMYGWKDGRAHYFTEDRTQDTVWEIPRPKRSEEHPTMKPVALVSRAIANSTKPGGIVLDVFGGSGTTLIAAEELGRTAYLMEIDPAYCDVIVKRWEDFTGNEAKLDG